MRVDCRVILAEVQEIVKGLAGEAQFPSQSRLLKSDALHVDRGSNAPHRDTVPSNMSSPWAAAQSIRRARLPACDAVWASLCRQPMVLLTAENRPSIRNQTGIAPEMAV